MQKLINETQNILNEPISPEITAVTSQWNYSNLLKCLGISHGVFVIGLMAVFLLSSFVFFAYKIGLLSRISFSLSKLPPKLSIVYISYQGRYDQIQEIFGQVSEDFGMVFKLSTQFGIYYDNPETISDPDLSRAVLGIVVDQKQNAKISLFLSKFPQYKKHTFQKETQYLGTKYPYFNAMSYIMVIMRVYPRLVEEMKKRHIQKTIGVMEIYRVTDPKWEHIEVLVPLENLDSFDLWYPPTAYSMPQKAPQTQQKLQASEMKKQN